MSLSNILMIGMFLSNNRMVFFSKAEKNSYHNKHVRDHTEHNVHMEGRLRGLEIYHMSTDSFVFKQNIYFSFLRMEGVGRRVTKLAIFCGHHKCMNPKWFKITSNSIIRGSNFFFSIKPHARYILTAQRTPSPSLTHPSPHSTDDQMKEHVAFI